MHPRSDLAKNQLDAIDWMVETPRGAIWKDIGLGKTVTALTALDILHQRFEIANTLVVAPFQVGIVQVMGAHLFGHFIVSVK